MKDRNFEFHSRSNRAFFSLIVLLAIAWLDQVSAQPVAVEPTIKLGPDPSLIAPMIPTLYLGGAEEGVLPNARVYKNVASGKIAHIEGTMSSVGATTTQQALENFLTANSTLLGLSSNLSELQLISDVADAFSHSLKYRQVYGGLPVINGDVRATVRNDLTILSIDIDLIPITPPPPPQNFNPTNSSQAIQAALKALKGTWVNNPQPNTEALIRVVNGNPTVVWKVFFANRLLMGWEPLIDANTLQPIEVRDLRVID